MTPPVSTSRRRSLTWAAAASLVALPAFAVLHPAAGEAPKAPGVQVAPLAAQELNNLPGQKLNALVVTYPPGGSSPVHHHAGSVFAFVLSGEIRSQSSATGPEKIYKAGESFFEPAGSSHLVSANASATEAASLLAVIVAEDGAILTTFDE
ncbi:cupin domain-containing protein [Pelagibius marinus]|uniref:cupin domain-containing protein n=1 Tax=Pelagibius marinus TaxID=2762760 RepID=UPI0018726CE0|nr:cupin domain-containing protein [Pelagibius marinus]